MRATAMWPASCQALARPGARSQAARTPSRVTGLGMHRFLWSGTRPDAPAAREGLPSPTAAQESNEKTERERWEYRRETLTVIRRAPRPPTFMHGDLR